MTAGVTAGVTAEVKAGMTAEVKGVGEAAPARSRPRPRPSPLSSGCRLAGGQLVVSWRRERAGRTKISAPGGSAQSRPPRCRAFSPQTNMLMWRRMHP